VTGFQQYLWHFVTFRSTSPHKKPRRSHPMGAQRHFRSHSRLPLSSMSLPRSRKGSLHYTGRTLLAAVEEHPMSEDGVGPLAKTQEPPQTHLQVGCR